MRWCLGFEQWCCPSRRHNCRFCTGSSHQQHLYFWYFLFLVLTFFEVSCNYEKSNIVFPDLSFCWHPAVLGNKQLILPAGCPRQGPAPCCSSGIAKATRGFVWNGQTWSVISSLWQSVWAPTSFRYSVLLEKHEGVGAGHFPWGLSGSGWMQDHMKDDAAVHRGCPESPWLQGFANDRTKTYLFLPPECCALLLFKLIGFV